MDVLTRTKLGHLKGKHPVSASLFQIVILKVACGFQSLYR